MTTENESLGSELGTKAYWESTYARELRNFSSNPSDEGTVWFDENNAEDVILKQLDKLARKGLLLRQRDGLTPASRFLDLGTGNGHLLFSLREIDDHDDDEADWNEGWAGEMVGVDYSSASIELAREIAASKANGEKEGAHFSAIRFEEWDILTAPPDPSWLQSGFDVVLDKGTLDAISLSTSPTNSDRSSRHVCEIYRDSVTPLLRVGGFLVLTSCNWTKEELLDWLLVEEREPREQLRYYDEAKYPTFTFGGKTGQSIVTVVLRRER